MWFGKECALRSVNFFCVRTSPGRQSSQRETGAEPFSLVRLKHREYCCLLSLPLSAYFNRRFSSDMNSHFTSLLAYSYLENSQDSKISSSIMEKSDFSTFGLNQGQSNKISMIKHRRHFPSEDTKSHIFGDDPCFTQSTTDSSENAAPDEADQENQQPALAAGSSSHTQDLLPGLDGELLHRFSRGGNRRNAHTPF